MGDKTNGKTESDRKADTNAGRKMRENILTRGIIEAEHPAVACLVTKTGGVIMVCNLDAEHEGADTFIEIFRLVKGGAPDDWFNVTTFNFMGDRAQNQNLFRVYIRCSDIVQVSEFNEDMWSRFIWDEATRAQAAAGGRSGIQVAG